MLLKAGFAQRSYAVVGQGQVDAILRASPAERKDFFEEAAGVKHYQVRKEQSLRKLETTRRNLVRVEDLVHEIKPRLNSLRRQAERARERKTIEQELHSLSLQWFGAELTALDLAAHQELSQLKAVQQERGLLEKKIALLEKTHSSAAQAKLDEEQKITAERLERSRKVLFDLEQQRNEARRQRAQLDQKELPIAVADLPERIAIQQAQLDRLQRRAKELVPQIQTTRAQVEAAEQQNQTTAKKAQELRTTLLPARPAKLDQREISQLVTELEKSLDQLIASIESAHSPTDLTSIKQTARRTRGQLEVLVAKVKRAQPTDQTSLGQELDRVLAARDSLLAELANTKAVLAAAETEHKL